MDEEDIVEPEQDQEVPTPLPGESPTPRPRKRPHDNKKQGYYGQLTKRKQYPYGQKTPYGERKFTI